MKDFNIKIVIGILISCFQMGYTQVESKECSIYILEYFDYMEKVLSPKGNQVYYMKYSTTTYFNESQNIPSSTTTSEMLLAEHKIVLNDGNMKVYGDQKDVFVVLPKVGKIYWNNSDPKLFTENSYQKKFLDVERKLLSSALNIKCTTKENIQYITIIPNKEFENQSGLIKQVLNYDLSAKIVTSVENFFGSKNKVRKQKVVYEKIDYKSTKKVKKPLEYIFNGTELKSAYKNFEIIDNRKN